MSVVVAGVTPKRGADLTVVGVGAIVGIVGGSADCSPSNEGPSMSVDVESVDLDRKMMFREVRMCCMPVS